MSVFCWGFPYCFHLYPGDRYFIKEPEDPNALFVLRRQVCRTALLHAASSSGCSHCSHAGYAGFAGYPAKATNSSCPTCWISVASCLSCSEPKAEQRQTTAEKRCAHLSPPDPPKPTKTKRNSKHVLVVPIDGPEPRTLPTRRFGRTSRQTRHSAIVFSIELPTGVQAKGTRYQRARIYRRKNKIAKIPS
jgi:hypothetical protein